MGNNSNNNDDDNASYLTTIAKTKPAEARGNGGGDCEATQSGAGLQMKTNHSTGENNNSSSSISTTINNAKRGDITTKSTSSLSQQARSSSDEFRRQDSSQAAPDRQLKSRLGQVKSLDAAESTATTTATAGCEATGGPGALKKNSTAGLVRPNDELRRSSVENPSTRPETSKQQQQQQQQQQHQRQMFSLKQLTLNKTRNLTGKKRNPLADSTNTTTAASKTFTASGKQVQDQSTDSTNSDEIGATKDPRQRARSAKNDSSSIARSGVCSGGRPRRDHTALSRATSDHQCASRDSDDEEELNSGSDDSYSEGDSDDNSDSEDDSEDEEDEDLYDEDEDEEDDYEGEYEGEHYGANSRQLDDDSAHSKSFSSGDELQQGGANMRIRLTTASGSKKELGVGGTPAPEPKSKGRLSAALSSKRMRRLRERRRRTSSICNCEPIISRLDLDCQPVTDIDLATYKHLCQLESRQQQLRAQQQRRGRRSCGLNDESGCDSGGGTKLTPLTTMQQNLGYNLQTLSTNKCHHQHQHRDGHHYHATLAGGRKHSHRALNRRLSLQEESGAYYELCVGLEERQIRQKYVWFPPSLKTLQLVDQFFSYFAKDKIPFNPAAASSNDESSIQQAKQNQQATPAQPDKNLTGSRQTITTTNDSPTQQVSGAPKEGPSLAPPSHPAASLACGSYRDEQISLQLPRQDISLDYCSYHMNEASRSSYLQFVDKRNSQSLDVGTVIQIKSLPVVPASSAGQSSGPAGASIKQITDTHTLKQQSRKSSNASQLSTIETATTPAAAAAGLGQIDRQTGALGAQRCRRCLIRFEHGQLAVVAPNFAIGTGLYHHLASSRAGPNSGSLGANDSTSIGAELLSAGSRRSSISLQQQQQSSSLLADERVTGIKLPSITTGKSSSPAPPLAKQNLAMFHPNCFTCSTCKEFLVDLVYCLRESKLYCLRHYGESLRPRCNWCQELIFSDEYLKAMNENFHVDHFLCRHCDSNLAGQRYVLKEEKPYCIGCYEENFANTCEDCQKPIGIDSRDLSYKDRHWHDTCFLCQQCQQSLIDKPFGSKGDKVYCADCYDTTFATRCDGCKNPFRAGSKKMEYRGRQWHDSCFCCCVCLNTIGSNSFIPKNEEIYCIKCYEDKYATRCTKCKQVIVSGGVTFRNEPWHRECFNCCNCNKSLAGQRFTTKDLTNSDTNSGNLNKTNQPHNAYCIDCYGELFAKKCFACSQAITGLGGTRFVTFEDRSWHNDCFICNECQVSLVGKGFITDGPDTILCGDCARAKLR